jgi:hypothetical protein
MKLALKAQSHDRYRRELIDFDLLREFLKTEYSKCYQEVLLIAISFALKIKRRKFLSLIESIKRCSKKYLFRFQNKLSDI